MLTTAKARGFKPKCVAFDSWFSTLANLKLIASYGWTWLTRLKRNRLVNPDKTGNRPICEVAIAASGMVVHLKGYRFIQVFKIVAPDSDIDFGLIQTGVGMSPNSALFARQCVPT
jgi:putative transposase